MSQAGRTPLQLEVDLGRDDIVMIVTHQMGMSEGAAAHLSQSGADRESLVLVSEETMRFILNTNHSLCLGSIIFQ